MRHLMRFFHKLRNFLSPHAVENDLAREVSAHLALLQDEFQRRGMSLDEARLAAKRAYGGVEQAKELHRDERSWLWLEQLRQDVRFAVRALAKNPGFSITAILTLALGIGANTAIFSLINAVILRTLPVSHPEQLVQVGMGKNEVFTNPAWEQLRDRQDVFSKISAYALARLNLSVRGEARYAQADFVSGGFFDSLGLRASAGRTLTTNDDKRGCAGTAVLSYPFWQSNYGGHADAIGKTISLDNHEFEIVGALKRGFTGVNVGRDVDVYVPLCSEKIIRGEASLLDQRGALWLHVLGRLSPGASMSQAEARLKVLAPRVIKDTMPLDLRPEARDSYLKQTFTVQLAGTGPSFIRRQYRQALMVLMAIAGVVLLIACANVANLQLARGAARQREIGIRLALGSGRGRLVRQLFTESLLLSITGAALGILLAKWGARLVVGLLTGGQMRVFLDLSIDPAVLFFTAALAVATALLFGVAPAWRGTRVDPQAVMRANARGAMQGSKFGPGEVLVVAQVAGSLVLLVAAGLMLSTLLRLKTLDPGFQREHVLLTHVDLRNAHFPPARRGAVFAGMLNKLRALPGVRSASASAQTPIDGSIDADYLRIEGFAAKVDTMVFFNQVSDRFFETLGTDLLAGRDFNAHDTADAPKVAIVNQTFARKFFSGQSPIGKRYRTVRGTALGDPVEIVGLVKDAKYVKLREEGYPVAYEPDGQDASPAAAKPHAANPFKVFEVRAASGDPAVLIPAVRSAIGEVNGDVSLEFTTLARQVDDSLSPERLLATLSGFFGGLATLLAMVGSYGVMSYNVTRRRNEIGIRMALGAGQRRVIGIIMAKVFVMVAAGLAIGISVALGTTRFLQSLLYGVKANDPWALCAAAAALALVAGLAGYLPARRAARLHPMSALREE